MKDQLKNPIAIIFLVLLLFSSIRSGTFSNPKEWILSMVLILPGIVIGLCFHEFAHAITAFKLGDVTPKFQGRVTINPLAHIDIFGFFALLFCGFGWGKAVEINPYNFRNRRRDELLVSLAGVVMNLLIAIVCTGILKIVIAAAGSYTYGSFMYYVLLIIVYAIQINLVLMIFNLIPIPPLDGFSVLVELCNLRNTRFYHYAYQYGQFLLFIALLSGIIGRILSPAVSGMMGLLFNCFDIPLAI